jgi:hypothetical protein
VRFDIPVILRRHGFCGYEKANGLQPQRSKREAFRSLREGRSWGKQAFFRGAKFHDANCEGPRSQAGGSDTSDRTRGINGLGSARTAMCMRRVCRYVVSFFNPYTYGGRAQKEVAKPQGSLRPLRVSLLPVPYLYILKAGKLTYNKNYPYLYYSLYYSLK